MKRTRFTESQIVASIKNRKAAYLPRMFAVSWVLAMLPLQLESQIWRHGNQ
ncbi:MAG: hypothetical protein IPQ27_02660 [Chitinophagaceae bacterium]|nr:hypothetical protein [Chitinophagaceae bacterium]MBL0253911.1 hypothetical protein [Chitinophagaceae bacterium]